MWANSHLNIIFVLCTECLLTASGSNNTQPKIYHDNGHLIIESAKDRNISFILPKEGLNTDNCTGSPCQTEGICINLVDDVRCKCPQTLRGRNSPYGGLYSPGWPGKYITKLNCLWLLLAPMGQRIVLDAIRFSLEKSDYVEIRDGYSDAPPIGRFYGIEIPSRIITITNSLYITFITNDNDNKTGFYFEWQATTAGCGGTLNFHSGSITPPHYPDLISPGAQCDWRIMVNPGSSIIADITSQNFEELGGCDTKQISVFNGVNPSAYIIKPNCSEEALHYTSTKNEMLIRYETEANEKSTFFVHYYAKCGGELRDIRRVVETPNFPNKYPSDLDCIWNIINRKGNKIRLAFSHLDLEGEYNKLRISDLKNGVVLNEYSLDSKEELKQTIIALGDILQIHLISYGRVSGTGFRFEYELQGCSKYFDRKEFGAFKSPDYPYAVDVYCEWIIETDYGKQIELRIKPTELEGSADDCLTNGLIVYSDEAHNNSLIKVCSTHPEEVFATSAGSRMFVTFFTDDVRAKKYFEANFKTIFGKCGGTYIAPKGYITSPNFPLKYSKGDYCEWLVETGFHHTVDLSFEYVNIPNTTNCEDSFLEVYDGSEKKDEALLLRHCGTTLPLITLIQSTKRNVLIVFSASKTTEPGVGFKIYYKRNCGRKIVNSGGFFVKQFNDNNCLWTIASTKPNEHVTLMFSLVECKCGTSLPDYCEQNLGLQIYDGDSIEAPLKTSFCNKHPPSVYSSGQALTIRGNSGYFEVYFDLHENACGGKLKSLRGQFASPKYPNSYPLNVECVWEIFAEQGNTLELSFDKIQIHKTSDQCNEDYVEVRERERGKMLGLFCDNEFPETIRNYPRLWIKFRSDGDFVGGGFLAKWRYGHENELNTASGIIKSPPIENVNIDPENYKWRITVPYGNFAEIYFEQYIDGLQLFDGFNETARLVEFEYKSKIISSTTTVLIKTVNSKLRPFRIRWESIPAVPLVDKTKGPPITSKIIVVPMDGLVNITNPGYPPGYVSHYEWILKANDSSQHVVVFFFGAELEKSSSCIDNYVEIYTGENMFNWTLIKTYCNEPIQRSEIEKFHGAPYSKVAYHTDNIGFKGQFLFEATTFCGGNMTEPEGVIKGSSISSTYIYGPKNCTWRIHILPGRRIQFQFTMMNIPASTDRNLCEKYVSIRDGFDEDAALLGQGMFCKGSNLTIPETATNKAFVHMFVSHFRDLEWELKYTTISDVCGGTIRVTKEHNSINITTLNYPNIPNPYSDCVWTVLGPLGESLDLTFLDFDLHESKGCATEFVEVRDGSTSVAKLIKKFCQKQPLITSTGNALYIKYFTNSSEPKNGFKAHITLSKKCGGTFNQSHFGVVISNNYPSLGGYLSNSICEYKISVRKGNGILITFNDVHLPIRQNRNESDHLTIYVENEENKNGMMNELTTIYGDNNVPSFIQTFSSEVLIKFFTYQPNTVYRGWRLTFDSTRSLCKSNIISEWGQIIIPRNIFKNEETLCTWVIIVPRGRRINLVVDEYDVDQSTPSDYVLSFYNDYDMISEILSTTNIADIKVVNSTENKIVVKLVKSTSKNFFAKLSFTSYELSHCPADITKDSGTIIAPDISETYCCSVEYEPAAGQTIAFKISELVLAYNLSVSNDTFQNSNFYLYKGGRIIFKTSRNITDLIVPVPFYYRNGGNILMIQDEVKKIKKLVIHYKIHDCGGDYYWASRYNDLVISTPDVDPQIETLDCAWIVSAAIHPNTLNATFSLNPDCEKEYILIYNGRDFLTAQMEKICGNGAYLQNFTSDIYIHYHKEAIFPSKFEIQFNNKKECGGQVYPSQSSPLLKIDKKDYKHNMECIWYLENTFGLTMNLHFAERFFIEESINCTKDYVEISALLDNEWKPQARFCGRKHPAVFKTTLTKLKIVSRTDNVTLGDGFRMYARQTCEGNFNVTKQSTTITSPEWLTNPQCIYNFETQTADRIKLHFNYLDMLEPCPLNRLEVYKKHHNVETYCSMEELGDIYSKDSVKLAMLVHKFSFTYQLESCGGIVTKETTIQTLSDENMICLWNITSQSNISVFIEFKYLNFHRNYCSEGYVEIFSGYELSTANKIAHVCGETRQQNVLYKISENKALVLAVSNNALNRGRGFSAQIRFRKKCDGNVILTQQDSTYIFDRFASGYEDNLNCIYEFSAPEGNYVTMNFHSFNLTACPQNSTCTCDFLEIRDGDGASLTLNKFCGDKLPPIVISSRNKLFVHFASDDAIAGQGFNATVTFLPSPCGGSDIIFNETKEIIIKSPDLNGYYPPNTVCHWTLHYEKPIEFNFDKFDLEEPQESGQCLDFLEISYYPFSFSNYPAERTRQILCGKQTSYTYFITKKSAELTFRSNSEVQRHGFRAKLRLADECNTTYTALSGMISKKPDNDECILYFNIPATYTLAFVLENDPLEPNCSKIVEFYDENTKQKVQTTCGSPQTAFINSNNVKVKFFKNTLRPSFSLRMIYIATNSGLGCGGNISALHGKIASPLYPQFDGIYNCQWNINVPQNFKVNISFIEFNIGSKETCSHINLKVLEVSDIGEINEMRRFCGDEIPSSYISTNNKLSLIYDKTINFNGTGWVISYHAEESSFEI